MISCLCVGLGGFTGAVGRYLLGQMFQQGAFPFTTMVINLAGSFLIGIIIGLTDRTALALPSNLVLFAKIGLCGGFTTFSTFSAETLNLLEHGKWWTAGAYAVVSVAVCIFAVWIGKLITASLIK